MSIKPISPNEVVANKINVIPEFVIEIVNRMITENWRNGRAVINQKDIVERMLSEGDDMFSRQDILDRHWLDFEDIYRQVGWHVEYDRPGYCETYPARFIFKRN